MTVDAVGASSMEKEHLERLKAAGCVVVEFNTPRWYSIEEVNYRTHRKILVVDGAVGFTGGVGVADHWLGNAQDKEHWRDTQVRMTGPIVRLLEAALLRELHRGSRRRSRQWSIAPIPADRATTAPSMVVRSSPTGGSNDLKRLYLLIDRRRAPDPRHHDAVLRDRRVDDVGARGCRRARRQHPPAGRRRHHRRDAGEVRVARRRTSACWSWASRSTSTSRR